MVILKKACIVLLVIIAAGITGIFFWSGDERAIRKQMALIEEVGSKKASEQPVESLVRAQKLARMFQEPCQLTIETSGQNGSFSRREIMERLARVRSFYSQMTVNLHDVTLQFPEKVTAAVRLTLRLSGESNQEKYFDVYDVAARLRKNEGAWLLTSVRMVEVPEK